MGRFFRHRSNLRSFRAISASNAGTISNNSEKDLALLQGVWEQVDDQIDGAAIPYRTLNAAGPHVTFAGNEFTVASAEGSVMLKGTFLLDATTIPRQLTWIDTIGPNRGKPIAAIYSVSETGFILAFTGNGATKPTDFRTDVDQTMRRFVRRPEHFS